MKKRRLQRGQAMVIMALAFVGLAAFIGLAVDAGILFVQIGHLRRAADAASLAAANQFREGRSTAQIDAAADEFIDLNNLTHADAHVYICDLSDPTSIYHDPSLCPSGGDPPRKFVRVEASMPVEFTFLPIVGWRNLNIHADAISETASVDLVLAIDTSPSMAYDAACDDGDDDDKWAEANLGATFAGNPDGDNTPDDCGGTRVGDFDDDYFRSPLNCNGPRQCHPFEEVRAAALALINRTYFPYDRIAIVSFDANSLIRIDLSSNKTDVTNALNALEVYNFPGCPGWPDPSLCTSTNIADGLKAAGNQFGTWTRPEAVWITVLLSDGAANAATDDVGDPICPGAAGAPTWVEPFCRDEKFERGDGDYGFDAEDAAVEAALFVGCPDALSPQPGGCPSPGQGAVIFTIGLGEQVTANTTCDAGAYPGGCEPDQGEKLLRFIAGAGDDNDPDTPAAQDPCDGVAVATSCGNYYFSPTGAGLLEVFEAIASRIFTRITH